MTYSAIEFGPELIGAPTGTLRAAAVVRPSPAIESAMPLNGEPGAIVTRALEQHRVLVRTMRSFGISVDELEGPPGNPYACAITDDAVVLENGAVLMRPTVMARRGEVEPLAAAFGRIDVPIAGSITAPGLLDGGDVLLAGDTFFIGAGSRGNEVGRSGFATVARDHGYNVVELRLAPTVWTLRNAVSVIGERTLVVARDCVDVDALSGFTTIVLERGEELGAGVICLGERHVIASVRYRTALGQMRRAGVTVEGIDLYEFEKVGLSAAMLVLPLRRA